MAILTEGLRTGEFLISEASGHRSRDVGTLAAGVSGTLQPGTVLGIVTASGHYNIYNPGASDGTETVKGVLFEAGAAGDDRVIVTRDAEVKTSKLAWFSGATSNQKATGIAALKGLGIVAR